MQSRGVADVAMRRIKPANVLSPVTNPKHCLNSLPHGREHEGLSDVPRLQLLRERGVRQPWLAP
jgi:hypothetical protein